MIRIGVVTGLKFETACLEPRKSDPGLVVVCAGANSDRAAESAKTLLRSGCDGLISFGVAGGLNTRLRPGTVVIADAVITADGHRLSTDTSWRERLLARIDGSIQAVSATIASSVDPVTKPDEKRVLAERTGAVAVDMESRSVVQVAITAGISSLVVRAIADPVDRAVPAWTSRTVNADGSTDAAIIAGTLLRCPWELPALVRLGLDFRRALRSLRRVAADAGPLFLFNR